MQIIDYKAQLKRFYKPSSTEVEFVEVPPMNYFMVDGQGDPDGSKGYQDAVEALFSAAEAVKSAIRKSDGIEYGIMPLEGLWWAEDMARFSPDRKAEWKWTLMIHQPTPVTRKIAEKAQADLAAKKPLAAMPRLRFESLSEGRVAQLLHLGPFDKGAPAVKAIQDRIRAIGAKAVGRQHEIYLSDTRKAAPEKWKTVVRQPYV
jgi:hypothetical protein